MKYFIIIIMALYAINLLPSINIHAEDNKVDSYPKWMDENTFRVEVTGIPQKGLTDPEEKKKSARKNAIIWAQKYIIESFKGARLEGAAGAADYASTGIAVAKEFAGIVRLGKIISEKFDDYFNCTIVYEVSADKLKQKVLGGIY